MGITANLNRHKYCAICEYWMGGIDVIQPKRAPGMYEIVDIHAKGMCRHPQAKYIHKAAMSTCPNFEVRGHLY